MSIPIPWKTLPKALLVDAMRLRSDWSEAHARACWKAFYAYQVRKAQKRDDESAWEIAWRAWVSRQHTDRLPVRRKVKGWWTSASGIQDKGKALGISYDWTVEPFPQFKERVLKAAGSGPWSVR